MIVDVTEHHEFEMMHIPSSLDVPRDLLESACCWGHDDTVPLLASNRGQNIVTVFRSGNRSALAAFAMQQMGFTKARSLKLGIKGWSGTDLELVDKNGNSVDANKADRWLSHPIHKDKLVPKK